MLRPIGWLTRTTLSAIFTFIIFADATYLLPNAKGFAVDDQPGYVNPELNVRSVGSLDVGNRRLQLWASIILYAARS
jgi:hypothetical protein